MAPTWGVLDGGIHISYFIGLSADETRPQSLLFGDRGVISGVGGSVINWNAALGTSIDADWDPKFHGKMGQIVLSDGSAHSVTKEGFRELIASAIAEGGISTNAQVVISLPQAPF